MRLYSYNGQITTYQITTEGKLYNTKTKNWLKGQINKNGYLTYYITIDGLRKRLYAHRMVAETYIPNPNRKEQVNHKDGNKLNNSVDNLEWVTCSENILHAMNNELNKSRKKIYCFNKRKELICTYESIAKLCELTGYNQSWLAILLQRNKKQEYKGYYWSYENNSNFEIEENKIGVKRPVGKFTLDNVLVEKYDSLREAAQLNHCDRKRLGECCNKKIKTYRGFIWRYI